ncbi:beta-galactosidase [Candidatus Daviesbacteria bacterium]|nr:beta-galactosidase [Candidatus Daviesbacteria bacterium]
MLKKNRKFNHLKHLVLVIIIGFLILLIVLVLGDKFFDKFHPATKQIGYGVSFSPQYSKDLGLDWKSTYISILDELKVKNLRIPTYWSVTEKNPGQFDYSEIDFMVTEAQNRNAKIILVLGARQPRWPECHLPDWAKQLDLKTRQKKTLEFIRKVVEKYRTSESIKAWQVENEPLLPFFGDKCDSPDRLFLKKEVDLVRGLDQRPIIVTDSGELRPWRTPMRLSDVFGTTLYRTVYNKVLGYTTYPLLPYFYSLKSTLNRKFFAPDNQKTIIVELQAEPWSPGNNLISTPLDQQLANFSLNNFKDYVKFAQRTGFDEIYLWGVEWWYWVRQKGVNQYWDYAKGLFE